MLTKSIDRPSISSKKKKRKALVSASVPKIYYYDTNYRRNDDTSE
jgi:hypothetical protein